MTGRVFILLIAFLFSACATTTSSTPQFPKVKMEGNRLVEPEYGYSVEIPEGWVIVDEAYVNKLDPDTRKTAIQAFERLRPEGLRAWFLDPSLTAGLHVFAAAYPQKTKEEIVAILRDSYKMRMKTENTNRGYEYFSNLQFDSFHKLTDFHLSYDEADTFKYVLYLSTYPFKGAEYAVVLALSGNRSIFSSRLPVFYKCVNSLSFSGRKPVTTSQEPSGNIAQRLDALKQLKEKGLITDKDYEKKKKQILNDL